MDEDDVAERRSSWVAKAVLARKKKAKLKNGSGAGAVSATGAASTRDTIVTILSEKVKADMAAVREGKIPIQLPQFTYSYFFTRYGLPEQTEERLMEFGEAVFKHRGIPDVARFGLSCGLIGEKEATTTVTVPAGAASGAAGELTGFQGGRLATTRTVGVGDNDIIGSSFSSSSAAAAALHASVPTDVNRVLIRGRTQRTAASDEAAALRGPGDAAFPTHKGNFSTGLQQLAMGDNNHLGVDTNHMNHALALDLAEMQTKVVPKRGEVNPELLMHPLAEEAAEALCSAVGVDAILGYVADRSFADAMASVDLGIMISEEQLPQLHVLMIEACDILGMSSYPLMYVKHHPTPAVYPWGVFGITPALVVTSAAIEVRELQATIAAPSRIPPGRAPVE